MINNISIIIPIYNVEKYLPKCLDSILSWRFKNWEAILIDDGSLDKSGQICDQYAKIESRFHVIHQENKGVSVARNTGLDKAHGEWIMFIDADDWVDGNLLFEQLQQYDLEDIQAILFGTNVNYKNESHIILPKAKSFKINPDTIKLPYYGTLGLWNLLYRRNLIEQLHLRFSPNIKMGEDIEFMMKYHIMVHNVVAITQPIYHYVRREGSATLNPQSARRAALDHLLFLRNTLAWAKRYNKRLPQWLGECLRLEIKTGLRMVYLAHFNFKECRMYTRHFKEIDRQWRKFGYTFFNTSYLRLAKISTFFCIVLLNLKSKIKH